MKKATKKTTVKKATAKKTATKKVVKKAAVKKTTKKTATKRGDSIRLRVFKLLAKNKSGLSGKVIEEKLALSGIPACLKHEALREKARISRNKHEGVRGVVYKLTVSGIAAVKNDTVDSDTPESSIGKK